MNLFRHPLLSLAGLGVVALALPAAAQNGQLEMLAGLSKGEWTIKHRDGSADRRVCVRSGEELIQLKHNETGCSRFVVADRASRVTVQYTCMGNGYGRTDIRKETSGLVQVESRGIVAGQPFQVSAEARRTGTC